MISLNNGMGLFFQVCDIRVCVCHIWLNSNWTYPHSHGKKMNKDMLLICFGFLCLFQAKITMKKAWTGPKFPGPLPSAVEATTRPTINPYKPRAFQTGSDSGWKCKNKLSWFLVYNLFCWIVLLHFLLLGLDWQLVSCFFVYGVVLFGICTTCCWMFFFGRL